VSISVQISRDKQTNDVRSKKTEKSFDPAPSRHADYITRLRFHVKTVGCFPSASFVLFSLFPSSRLSHSLAFESPPALAMPHVSIKRSKSKAGMHTGTSSAPKSTRRKKSSSSQLKRSVLTQVSLKAAQLEYSEMVFLDTSLLTAYLLSSMAPRLRNFFTFFRDRRLLKGVAQVVVPILARYWGTDENQPAVTLSRSLEDPTTMPVCQWEDAERLRVPVFKSGQVFYARLERVASNVITSLKRLPS
jgi:hypothetical protein